MSKCTEESITQLQQRVSELETERAAWLDFRKRTIYIRRRIPARAEECQGWLDGVRREGERWLASGWARTPGTTRAADEVVVFNQSGKILAYARVGALRSDVSDAQDNPQLLHSGWEASFADADLDEGENRIQAYVYTARNQTARQLHQEVTIVKPPGAGPAAARNGDDSSWEKLYRFPLIDMGITGRAELQGIYSRGYTEEEVRRYIQAQFLDAAANYAEKYASCDYWRVAIVNALTRAGRLGQARQAQTALDLGSGAGNSILPLLELCPQAQVIASDLSIEMLALLKKALAGHAARTRCRLLQLNAEELDFADESVDLVVGAAILHHLLSPEKTIAGCSRILKEGGCAIFFEPFESGNAILRLAFEDVLSQRWARMPENLRVLMQRTSADVYLRKGRDKSDPAFGELDDKWIFTQSCIREWAERYGFAECLIFPLHALERPFEGQVETLWRLAFGQEKDRLPDWVRERLRRYDEAFSEDAKSDLLIEAGMVLIK